MKVNFPEINELDHPMEISYKIDNCIKEIESKIKKLIKDHYGKIEEIVWVLFWKDIYLEWAKWSHKINKITKQQIEKFGEKEFKNEELRILYKYVYAYWWNRNELIKLKLSKRPGSIYQKIISKKALKKNEIIREKLFMVIIGAIDIKEIDNSFNSTINKILNLDSKGIL